MPHYTRCIPTYGRINTLYFSSLLPFVSSEILRDRETGVSCRSVAGDQDKLVCKVIQGTPEVLDNIPGCGNRVEWNGPQTVELTAFLKSGFRVLFSKDDVRIFARTTVRL